jgi:hypothetical protein
MKHRSLFILLLTLSCFACRKDKNSTPILPVEQSAQPTSFNFPGYPTINILYNESRKITSLTYPYDTQNFPAKLTYNSSGKLIKEVTPRDSTIYTYNNAGQVSGSVSTMFWKDNTPLWMITKIEYKYNANGTVASMLSRHSGFQKPTVDQYLITYKYDTNGLLKGYTNDQSKYKYQETTEIEGYNDEMNIDPIVLNKVILHGYHLGFPLLMQMKKFPKSLKTYANGKLTEASTYIFSISNKRINVVDRTVVNDSGTFHSIVNLNY